MTAVLGVSAGPRDAAATLVVDGVEAAFEREESGGFPFRAIERCLDAIGAGRLDYVAFDGKPLVELDRLLETSLATAPRGLRVFLDGVPSWLEHGLPTSRRLAGALGGAFDRRYVFCARHESISASAFFLSPFEAAAILTFDGGGEWTAVGAGVGRGNRIELTREQRFPHSPSLLIAAFASYCGLGADGGAALAELAARGEPRHAQRLLEEVTTLGEDGSLRVDLSYLEDCNAPSPSAKLHGLLGGPPRAPGAPVEPRHADAAASIRSVAEEVVLRCARHLHETTRMRVLCVAGDVAHNCGERVLREGPFEDVWLQPDAGGARGAAAFLRHQLLDEPRARRARQEGTARVERPVVLDVSDEVLDAMLVSPCCGSQLARREQCLVCTQCEERFDVTDGIPQLFRARDAGEVTQAVKDFYEATPFPDYDEHDSPRTLVERARRGRYARWLDEALAPGADVLEVGCGTGQLANYLGLGPRRVIGTDVSLRSLRCGDAFRAAHGLARVRFVQMDLFRPAFAAERFDVVVCNGVLHHTADPRAGFRELLALVKRGGYLIVGLYNRWGRLLTDTRRVLLRGRARGLDPLLRGGGLGPDKRRAWLADQYEHPHESKHTFGEVLRWFDESGVDFVRGTPALCPGEDHGGGGLFDPQPRGNAFDRAVAQAMHVFGGHRSGGFFTMIGRRP